MPSKSTTPSPPELTCVTRVASIPVISSAAQSVDSTLVSYTLTRLPYCTVKDLSSYLYRTTEPLQRGLRPLIEVTDKCGNKVVDVVQYQFPYVFEAKPEEIASYIRQRKQSASEYVFGSYEEKVKTPALSAAQNIDQRFEPLMNYVASKLGEDANSSAEAKYQYQRAMGLSRNVGGNLYNYSNEQLKALQEQSIIAQKVAETAQSCRSVATSGYASAQSLADSMLCQVKNLQASTANFSSSLQNSASSTVQNGSKQAQQIYSDFSTSLSSTATEMTNIMKKDVPMQKKMVMLNAELNQRVTPVAEAIMQRAQAAMARGRSAVSPSKETPIPNGINGNGH